MNTHQNEDKKEGKKIWNIFSIHSIILINKFTNTYNFNKSVVVQSRRDQESFFPRNLSVQPEQTNCILFLNINIFLYTDFKICSSYFFCVRKIKSSRKDVCCWAAVNNVRFVVIFYMLCSYYNERKNWYVYGCSSDLDQLQS